MNIHLIKWTQEGQARGQLQLLVMSQKNSGGIKHIPTQKSAAASETTNALVLVRSCRLLLTRKIINPFPVIVRMERNQPRIQNQVSILERGGFSSQLLIVTFNPSRGNINCSNTPGHCINSLTQRHMTFNIAENFTVVNYNCFAKPSDRHCEGSSILFFCLCK